MTTRATTRRQIDRAQHLAVLDEYAEASAWDALGRRVRAELEPWGADALREILDLMRPLVQEPPLPVGRRRWL